MTSATPSADVIYWPPKVCPQTANCETRGDACIYLLPRSDSSSEAEWPLQEIVCSVPLKAESGTGNAIYNYTVTMVPRFPENQVGSTIFLQPSKWAISEPVAYNMVIRAPASLHNHLPVPITFDLCVSSLFFFPLFYFMESCLFTVVVDIFKSFKFKVQWQFDV